MDEFGGILSNVYARTGALHPRLSYAAVFVIGGLLLCVARWSIGENYKRDEQRQTRINTADDKLQSMQRQIDALRTAPPIINVTAPPITVSAAAPHVPAKSVSLGLDKTVVKLVDGTRYAMTVGIANNTDSPIDADMSMALLQTEQTGRHETSIPVTSPWHFEPRTVAQLSFTLNPLTNEQLAAIRAGTLTLAIHATADYHDGDEQYRYEFEGAFSPDSDSLNITVNKRLLIKKGK